VPCGNAIGCRVGLAADWVCLLRSLPRRPDRGGTPTAVRAGPISGGSSANVSSYVDTACNQRCQTRDVRASSKGNRADVGAICWRATAIEYYPGRKDRQTAPRRLVRLPLVPRLCLGTQCPQAPPASPRTHCLEPEAEPRQQCVPRRSLGTRVGQFAGGPERSNTTPGRKDRQTAPRRLVRLERKSWLRDGRPSRATSDPGRLVRPVKESRWRHIWSNLLVLRAGRRSLSRVRKVRQTVKLLHEKDSFTGRASGAGSRRFAAPSR
jgi:hypothetical protein